MSTPPTGTPPPPPPAAGPLTCPKCQTTNSPTSRFCSACGASLGPATVPPAGAPPPAVVDIRQKVDQDRGFLKKLQLLLPGFRGYRQGEDDRAADSMLRMQVADRVHRASGIVTTARASLTNSGDFAHLNDLAQLASELSVTSLDRLYEYDYGFVQAADSLTGALAPLNVPIPSTTDAAAAIQNGRSVIRQLQAAFQARTKAVQGIQV
jgi:hypothetical protein